jgi:predicted transcriptional regulator
MTYYTVTEQFTARTDMKWNLKAVLINIINKVQIPKDMLNGQEFYTFSVSNVSQEMGIPESTTSDQFKILEKLGVLKFSGTKITSHGKVKLFIAESDILSKLITGEIELNPKKGKETTTATVEAVTATVGGATASHRNRGRQPRLHRSAPRREPNCCQ